MAFSWTNSPRTPSVHETRHFHGQTHQNIPSVHETGRFHGQTPPRTPSVHETRHFHGQTPGPRLHRHRAGGASPLAKLAQPALSGWPAYSPAALPPPQHDRIMTSHHKHHPNVLFQYPSVKPHELPNPQKGTWRTNERIQEWESRHKINCASLLIKLAQFQLSGLSSHPEAAYPMKHIRIKPEIYWREIRMRSARVIAVTASTTTGALSAKHTSWRPGTSRESILPVAKLNVS